MAELHGNTNLESCTVCKRQYMRDFRARTIEEDNHEHLTGRTCEDPECGGALKDSDINFGEGLEPDILQKAFEKSTVADLYLCMGSSMRVSPANTLPQMTFMNGGRVVIMNLQKTPSDILAESNGLLIHERVDKIMEMTMRKLEMPIPDFRRHYRLRVSLSDESNEKIEF